MAPADSALTVYIEHRGELVNYAHRIVRDRASAEDVVQEAWLRFNARRAEGAEIAQPIAYLYTVVRNLALNWAKRASHQAHLPLSPLLSESVASEVPTADQLLHHRDELRVLTKAIAELPARTRLAFVLYRLEGLTLHEVAARLGISAVRVHQIVKEAGLHAARRLYGDRD